MTYRDFLARRVAELDNSETPFLDASLLLARALGIPRDEVLASLGCEMPDPPLIFQDMLRRRRNGESVAHILGEKEFFGRLFHIDHRVLCPRPDTEILVEAALETGDRLQSMHASPIRVHDACTGSGAIAVSLAAERPAWMVSASDISADALEVAGENARMLAGGNVAIVKADLLEGLSNFNMIVSNPPYVPTRETDALLEQGWNEPRLALDGGPDGFDIIGRLVDQAKTALVPGGFLLVETDSLQVPVVRAMLRESGYADISVFRDLGGRERVTRARRAP